MGILSDFTKKIRNAIYVKDVRDAIADGLEHVESLEEKNLETYNNMVIGAGESNAEIVDARLDNTTGKRYEKVGKRLDNLSSEIAEKANMYEVRKNNVSIKMEDLDTEVKSAMTGGAVAVVGKNAVGNENIKSKAVDCTKIDDTVAEASLVNLFNTSKKIGIRGTEATVSESEGVYSIVTSASYGRLDITLNNVVGSSKMLMMCKVKATDSASVNKNVSLICYNYSITGTNLGQICSEPAQPLTSDWQLIMTTDIILNEQATKAVFGILSPNSSYQVKDIVICRIGDIPSEMVKLINFKKINNGYWYSSMGSYHPVSMISNHSKYSDKSEVSNYALDGNFIKPIIKYENIAKSFSHIIDNNRFLGNGADVTLNDNQEFIVTPTKSYGQLLIWTPNKTGVVDVPLTHSRRYKFVAKVKSTEENVKVYPIIFMRGQDGANLGSVQGDSVTLTNEYQYIMFDFTINKTESYRLEIGVTNDKAEPYAPFNVKDLMLIDITDENLTSQQVLTMGGYWAENPQIVEIANKSFIAEKAMTLDESCVLPGTSKWKGKTALVIGDSITAAKKWQKKLNEDLGMIVKTHAKGGVGTVAMVDGDKGLGGDYDNETSASGTLYPLNTNDVTGVDLIVVLPAYNDRGKDEGAIGDVYPNKSTIIGIVQYMINRIYEELAKANNLNCKILFATPHCAGKYNYIDADGYEEYPSNSGRTMETLSDAIKLVCNYNNIAVCDLWHNSGINKFTWTIYGANVNAVNEQYAKYELNAQGEIVGSTPLRYVTGQSYYQWRDGVVVLEKYTGASPYPFNSDQLHCGDLGYARIGECVVGSIIKSYGY